MRRVAIVLIAAISLTGCVEMFDLAALFAFEDSDDPEIRALGEVIAELRQDLQIERLLDDVDKRANAVTRCGQEIMELRALNKHQEQELNAQRAAAVERPPLAADVGAPPGEAARSPSRCARGGGRVSCRANPGPRPNH